MGRIWVSGGVKGGVGKTATATSVAALLAGRGPLGLGPQRVALVDLDEQEASLTWSYARAARHGERPDLPQITVRTIDLSTTAQARADLLAIARDHDVTIVDVAARDAGSQRLALGLAEAALIPFVPEAAAVWTADKVCVMLGDVRKANPGLQAFAFLNRVPGNGKGADAAAVEIEQAGCLSVLPCRVKALSTTSDAFGAGLAGFEMKVQKSVRDQIAKDYSNLVDCVWNRVSVSQTVS